MKGWVSEAVTLDDWVHRVLERTDNKRAPNESTVLLELGRWPEEDRTKGVERKAEMNPFLQRPRDDPV